MKAGTTTLWADLRSTPGIFMPFMKEPSCLASEDVLSGRGRAKYAHHFKRATEGVLVGDASTAYTKLPDHPGVPERAYTLLGPDLKLIYLVRDPIDRLISQHKHEYGFGLMPASLGDALAEFDRLIQYSRYQLQLEPWINQFGKEALRVVTFENYIRQRRSAFNDVLNFLGARGRPLNHDSTIVHNADQPRIPVKGRAFRLLNNPIYWEALRPLIPSPVRRAIGRVLAKDLPPPLGLPAETLLTVGELFREDLEWLRDELQVDVTLWPTWRQIH